MRIAMVEPGGFRATFQYTHNLCNALGRRGHEVILVTATKFETEGFPREYEAVKVFDRWRPRPGLLRKFVRRMREFQPEILHVQGHSHPTSYLFIHWLVSKVCKARFVYTAQDVIPKKRLPHHLASLRRLYRVTEHIFVNAAQNRDIVVSKFGADPDKISVHAIPDLLDFLHSENPERSPLVPANRKVILFFGNIEPRKGVRQLIRSFPAIHEQIPEAYLLIIGKPMLGDATPYEVELAKLKPEIRESIGFYPGYLPLEDIPRVFTFADVAAIPYTEGWNSGAIASAFCYGKPVIATNIGGFAEVIRDGENGFMVPPGDPAAIADAAIRMLSSEDTLAKMSAHAKKSGDDASWDVVAAQVEDHYAEL